MNPTLSTRDLFRSLCVALLVTLALATLARAQASSTPPTSPPAATDPAVAPPAPEETPAASANDDKSGLHRIDAAPAASVQDTSKSVDEKNDDATSEQPTSGTPARDKKATHPHLRFGSHGNGNEIVSVGHDSHLAKGNTAEVVVSVFGSSTAEGDVSDSVVSVFGNTRATGAVADSAVAVFGSTYVNGRVNGEVVAVFGNVELGPDAEVYGDVVAVGGTVKRDEHSITHGQVNNVSAGGAFADMEWLKVWVIQCAFHGRLLAFGSHLAWAWWVALSFLALYALLALLFRGGIEKCEQTFESRPGYAILTALLSVLIVPIVLILLAITGVGLILWPFILAGVLFATLFGKAVMLAWLGRRCTSFLGPVHPAVAVLVGGVIVLVLYLVPILGLIIYKLFGWLGMGVVIYTLILGMKREKPAPMPPVLGTPDPTAAGMAGAEAGAPLLGAVTPIAPVVGESRALVTPPPLTLALLPRAGFWIRMCALVIDGVLLMIVMEFSRHLVPFAGNYHFGPGLLPVLAIYGAVMWGLKGTTIGGIIFGLKVVRLDDRPLDWPTAIVRALGCFLSFVALGIGFIWVAFDSQRQSWHDKIAGTTVVRVPKGMSLV